jgi:AraC-like DNA-binding protein
MIDRIAHPSRSAAMLRYAGCGDRDYRRRPIPAYPRGLWEFELVVAGAIAPVFPGPARPVFRRAPWLWVLPPDLAHGWTGDGGIARVAVLHLAEVPPPIADAVDGRIPAAVAAQVAGLVATVVADRARPTTHAAVRAAQAAAAMLAAAAVLVPERPLPSTPAGAAGRIDAAEAFLRAHLDEGAGVADAARAVGLSEPHFRRLVRAVRGTSARDLLAALRRERAAQILAQGGATLATAAAACGLGSASSLCRLRRRQPPAR